MRRNSLLPCFAALALICAAGSALAQAGAPASKATAAVFPPATIPPPAANAVTETAPAVAPPAAPAATVSPKTADEAFTTRVKTLEEQISDLKEKILLSKGRLQSLQEKVLGGDLSSGARVVLNHKKELGSGFMMQSISYALDGAPIKTRVDEGGDLNALESFEVFNGPIVAGNHQLAVRMVLKGGTRGLFSYASDYSFTVSNSFTFNAEAGKQTTVNVVSFEKGGFTAQLQDKPGFRFETQVTKEVVRRQNTPPGTLPSAPTDGK